MGPKGDKGTTGFAGSFGYTGSRGYWGSVGYTGSYGDQGYWGSVGYTGSEGYWGSTGYVGSEGYWGSVGYTGSDGYTGSEGYWGSVGYVGSEGYTGSEGYWGSVGYTGSEGYYGSFGYTGSEGYWGSFGYTGSASDVIGYTGSEGYYGSVGYTGSEGYWGSIGYSGSFGDTGYWGSVGYVGSKGIQGPIGYTGSIPNLETYTGNISAGNINVDTYGVYSAHYYWANGEVFASSSYSNVNVGEYLTTYTGNISANTINGSSVYALNIGNIGSILTGTLTHSEQNNIDVMSGLTSFGRIGNTTTAQGDLSVVGNLNVTGNINAIGNVYNVTITGNSGQFFGDISGFNALYAGIGAGYLISPQMAMQISTNFNGYAGVNMQNINGGPLASTDMFWTPDNGSFADTFLNIGIASSNYNYPGYSIIRPNDAYIIAYGNTTTSGGNLIVNTGLNNDIIFATNGSAPENEVMRITGANVVNIRSTINSTNTSSGALVVAGGVGIGDGLNVTNNVSVGGNLIVSGVVATGTWNATTINSSYGGTGFSNFDNFDLLVGNTSAGLAKLPIGLPGQILQVNADGNAILYAYLDGGTF